MCLIFETTLYKDITGLKSKVFFTSEKKLSIGDYRKVKIDDVVDLDLMGSLAE